MVEEKVIDVSEFFNDGEYLKEPFEFNRDKVVELVKKAGEDNPEFGSNVDLMYRDGESCFEEMVEELAASENVGYFDDAWIELMNGAEELGIVFKMTEAATSAS